jgi:hypothetical protein
MKYNLRCELKYLEKSLDKDPITHRHPIESTPARFNRLNEARDKLIKDMEKLKEVE